MNPATDRFPILKKGQVCLAATLLATVTACATNETFYESRGAQYQVPEARQASHILISTEASGAADARQKAWARAQEIHQQLLAEPESFSELAKKHSQDPGSASNGGDLGLISRGAMRDAPAFEAALFKLKEGEISPPVESRDGFHIIRLTKIQPAQGTSFGRKSSTNPASLVIPDGFTTNGRDASVRYVVVDLRSGDPSQVDLSPGPHALNVYVKWSNGYMDGTSLAMNAEAGRNYRVNAFELHPGQNPDDAMLRPGPPRRPVTADRSLGMDLASSAMIGAVSGAIYGSAFLWGPFYLLYQAVSPSTPSTPAPSEPKARPFEKCCFVWIEDMSDGALVGGERPSSLKRK